MRRSIFRTSCFILSLCISVSSVAQVTSDQLQAKKNEAELATLNALQDLMLQQKEAEVRKAIADAERSEAIAKIPPSTSVALAGKVDTSKFGAVGSIKAFDLANQLAAELCAVVPGKFMVYNAAVTLAIAASKNLELALTDLTVQMGKTRGEINEHLDPVSASGGSAALAIPMVTGAVKAVADLASLAKTNTTYTSEDFGDMSRPLFITALASNCKDKAVGLGSGYLGELNDAEYKLFQQKVDVLNVSRETLANRQKSLQEKLDSASKSTQGVPDSSDAEKSQWKTLLGESATLIKFADTLIASLGSPGSGKENALYNAAIYSSYAKRTQDAIVLDFDLKLDGLTINRENLFTGQKVSLSGVAFLWYRLHARDGAIIMAKSLRAITKPEQITLSGERVSQQLWGVSPK